MPQPSDYTDVTALRIGGVPVVPFPMFLGARGAVFFVDIVNGDDGNEGSALYPIPGTFKLKEPTEKAA